MTTSTNKKNQLPPFNEGDQHQETAEEALTASLRRNSDSTSQQQHCLVCYDELEYITKTPCEHNQVCGVCHLRLRYLHEDRKCPICKTENEQVIVDEHKSSGDKKFEDYNIWGNDLGGNYEYRDDVGMFFHRMHYDKTIKPLFGYHCTKPNCYYDGLKPDINIYEQKQQQQNSTEASNDGKPKIVTQLRGLQDHLRNKHQLTLCQLCVDHKRDFVARLPRFTPSRLKQHLVQGDGKGSGFEGHPICEFCRPTRFYDITHLHQHLNKEHYKCHVCEKRGLANQFFKNYRSLERHFDNQHFLCKNPQCLSARFVVFENELDLQHHERQVHGGTSSGSKIQLEFRVRRHNVEEPNQEVPTESDFNYSLDGQAFVPADLPQSSDAIQLHPRHVERTEELRRQAETIRRSNSTNQFEAPDAFPDLTGSTETGDAAGTGQQPLRVGWTSGTTLDRLGGRKKAGQVTDEDFPSLPSSAPSKKKQLFPKMKPNATSLSTIPPSGGWTAGSAAAATRIGSRPLPSSVPSFGQPRAAQGVSHSQRIPSSEDFPSLAASSKGPKKKYSIEAFSKRSQPAPSWTDADFPAVASALGNTSHLASGNVLKPPSSSATASVEDIKAQLGPIKYKELKSCVKRFTSKELGPEEFIDHTAALFDRGYADKDFWSFLPGLLESFPDEFRARQAMEYMEELKRMKNGVHNAESVRTNQATVPISWGSRPRVAVSSTPYGARVASSLNSQAKGGSNQAWQKPASTSTGKQQNQQSSSTASLHGSKKNGPGNGKKKKQNDELRKLAFG